jgi:hypothetical protein
VDEPQTLGVAAAPVLQAAAHHGIEILGPPGIPA